MIPELDEAPFCLGFECNLEPIYFLSKRFFPDNVMSNFELNLNPKLELSNQYAGIGPVSPLL